MNSVYQIGETSEIRCSTGVAVQSIQWLDGSSRVVRQGTSVQEIVLDLTIAASDNNSRYKCKISQGTFIGERMITINIRRKRIVCLSDCGNYQWYTVIHSFMHVCGMTVCHTHFPHHTSFVHSINIVSSNNSKWETSGGANIHSNMCC